MTYNLQQGVDYFGTKSYQQQLAVIKKINPDILSRFSFSDFRSIFTYSDKDEIGTAVCHIVLNNKPVLVISNHPAGHV